MSDLSPKPEHVVWGMAVLALVVPFATSGCTYEPKIEGYDLTVISHYNESLFLEVWSTSRPESENLPETTQDVGPGPHELKQFGFLSDCPGSMKTVYLKVYLKEPTSKGVPRKTLLVKQWNGLICGKKYTLIIDEHRDMNLYRCTFPGIDAFPPDPACTGNDTPLATTTMTTTTAR